MQILCGQCGTQLTVELLPGMTFVQCTNCGHEIQLGDSPKDDAAVDDFSHNHAEPSDGFANQAQRVLRERIVISCAKCGGKMKLPRRLMGKKIRCKDCSKILQIPRMEDIDELNGDAEKDDEILDAPDDNGYFEDTDDYVTEVTQLRTHRGKWRWIVIAVVVLIVAGLILCKACWPTVKQTTKDDDISVRIAGVSDARSDGRDVRDAGGSDEQREATVTVEAVKLGMFEGGRYFPAPVGKMYSFVTVQIAAEDSSLGFDDHGSDVVLVLDGEKYESLGQRAYGDADVPMLGQRGTVHLGAGESSEVTFVFEIPTENEAGTLQISGVDDVAIPVMKYTGPGSDFTITGSYREVAPRNLKPLLEDPVMEAIQNTTNQRLIISKTSDGVLSVDISQSGVSGRAYTAGDAVFDVVMQKGRDTLRGNLRWIGDGNMVIFYLHNSPMHQITYQREILRPRPEREYFRPDAGNLFD